LTTFPLAKIEFLQARVDAQRRGERTGQIRRQSHASLRIDRHDRRLLGQMRRQPLRRSRKVGPKA